MKARLILADDHPMILQGLRDLIDSTTDMMVVAATTSGNEAELLARTIPADLLLLDLTMPDRNGISVLGVLRADDVDLPVLVFTMAPASQYAASVLHVGAQGFIGKEVDSDELIRAIRQILKGGTSFPSWESVRQLPDKAVFTPKALSLRESQVLQGLLTGSSQVEIAAALGINAATANTYLRRILEKFGVKNLYELIKLQTRIKL